MAIKLFSDIHGAYAALKSALTPSDTLLLLGDYANFVDFETLDGIVADIITKERLVKVLLQVAGGDFTEAEELVSEFTCPSGSFYEAAAERLAESYRTLFASISCEAYLIFGNNDYPDILQACATENAAVLHGDVVTINGLRFGFVSGSPPHKILMGMPGDMDHVSYSATVELLGPVDILCTHVPPAGLGLEYDAVMARDEASSGALTEYIRTHRPRYAFHGHIHNPAKDTAIHADTIVQNLGYFRRHQKAFILDVQ